MEHTKLLLVTSGCLGDGEEDIHGILQLCFFFFFGGGGGLVLNLCPLFLNFKLLIPCKFDWT